MWGNMDIDNWCESFMAKPELLSQISERVWVTRSSTIFLLSEKSFGKVSECSKEIVTVLSFGGSLWDLLIGIGIIILRIRIFLAWASCRSSGDSRGSNFWFVITATDDRLESVKQSSEIYILFMVGLEASKTFSLALKDAEGDNQADDEALTDHQMYLDYNGTLHLTLFNGEN